MEVTRIAPSERLAQFVRTFTIIETADEATRLLMPDSGVIVGLRYRGSAIQVDGDAAEPLPDASIAGMRNTMRRMRTSANGGVVLAMFQPGGAAQFFAEPLHELFGHTHGLDDLMLRSEVEDARSRIAEARDHAECVAIFEKLLLRRQSTRTPDAIVAEAVRALRATRGSLRISALARHLGIAQDPLEKRFRRSVGATPKQLARILRLQRVVDAHRAGASLTRASIDAGYFDQSHFNREFRAVTGEAPSRFFSSAYCV